MLKEHNKGINNLQKVVDSLTVFVCWFLAYVIRFRFIPNGQPGLEMLFLKLSPFLIILTLYTFYKNELYKSQRFTSRYYEIFSVVKANTFAVIAFIIILYFFGQERVSRLTLAIYFSLSTLIHIIVRISIRNFLRYLRKKGRNLRHVLLVGNGKPLVDYVHNARFYKDSGIRFLGWIDSGGLAPQNDIQEITENYDEYRKVNIPDSVILSYQGKDVEKVSSFIATHYNDIVPIQILPDLSYSLIGHKIEDFAGIPLLSVNAPTFNGFELFLKRLLDLVGSFTSLILFSPFFLIIGILIKLSSKGPVFYSQDRIGLDGKHFTMWKFRTMKVADSNEDQVEWSNKDNPRKTAIGEFLRKTSIDELPQLWNVLVGDMSLIGPRPERPFFVEKFKEEIPGYMLRHKMRAGLSGWAQVNGWRGDTSIEKRIECDIYYIKNWTFWFDVKIFFLTFFKGFINKNAY